jgi:hypothetical protein
MSVEDADDDFGTTLEIDDDMAADLATFDAPVRGDAAVADDTPTPKRSGAQQQHTQPRRRASLDVASSNDDGTSTRGVLESGLFSPAGSSIFEDGDMVVEDVDAGRFEAVIDESSGTWFRDNRGAVRQDSSGTGSSEAAGRLQRATVTLSSSASLRSTAVVTLDTVDGATAAEDDSATAVGASIAPARHHAVQSHRNPLTHVVVQHASQRNLGLAVCAVFAVLLVASFVQLTSDWCEPQREAFHLVVAFGVAIDVALAQPLIGVLALGFAWISSDDDEPESEAGSDEDDGNSASKEPAWFRRTKFELHPIEGQWRHVGPVDFGSPDLDQNSDL